MKQYLNEEQKSYTRRIASIAATILAITSLLYGSPMFAQAQDQNSDGGKNSTKLEETSASDTNKVMDADEGGAFRKRFGLANPDASDNAGADESDSGRPHRKGLHRDPLVVFGKDAVLKTNETAEGVVVIGGSAKIQGKVTGPVVSIGGDVTVDGGEVDDAVVAVLGGVHAINGAKINGDATSVGGTIAVSENSTVEHGIHEVDFETTGLHIEWLKRWFYQCVLKLRPLAPQVGWVWGVAAFFFIIYFAIVALFPRPVMACVDVLSRRPATSFLTGLLTKLLVPIAVLILALTGIGALVVPFVFAAMILGYMVGKVAIASWIGLRLGSRFAGGQFQKPIAGFFIGTIVILLLYMVPVIGLITFAVLTVWGLGCVVTAAFDGWRRELPRKGSKPPATPEPSVIPPQDPAAAPVFTQTAPMTPVVPIAPFVPGPQPASEAATAVAEPPPTPLVGPQVPAGVPEVLAFPRAGIWPRLAAGFLDLVLVGIGFGLVGGPPQGFLVALAYFAAMWTWKGTTVGGVIVGLKVARLDGQPVSVTVAIVRCLACMFGVMVFFLGFLWIAWDDEKQGWHDKIAGTVVLRLPKGTPLV